MRFVLDRFQRDAEKFPASLWAPASKLFTQFFVFLNMVVFSRVGMNENDTISMFCNNGGGLCVLCVSVTVATQNAGAFFHASDSSDTNSSSHMGGSPVSPERVPCGELDRRAPRGRVCPLVGRLQPSFTPHPRTSAHAGVT